MIFVDPLKLFIPADIISKMSELTKELKKVSVPNRSVFIEDGRKHSWGKAELVDAMQKVIGNKCWYSELELAGSDPNIDHFRPKGRVVEVDNNMARTGIYLDGYWWLAFEPLNYRLSAEHSNQRRVEATAGGKADFFPIRGSRAKELTPYPQIFEDILPLDPCSISDVSLMWFDPEGRPCYFPKNNIPNPADELRIKVTIWLYHLDKSKTAALRAKDINTFNGKLSLADTYYQLWNAAVPCLKSKASFDNIVAEIASLITDDARFAGAKRCALRIASSKYDWIDLSHALRY